MSVLPPLRQDLSLHDGPPAQDGSPTWMLHDPAANRFYALTWSAFEILSRWPLREPAAVVAAVNQQTTLDIQTDDLEGVIEFLMQHSLLDASDPADSARLLKSAAAAKLSVPQWLLKNYLFVRVPLVRPAQWLERWAPRIAWVSRRRVSRQASSRSTTMPNRSSNDKLVLAVSAACSSKARAMPSSFRFRSCEMVCCINMVTSFGQ